MKIPNITIGAILSLSTAIQCAPTANTEYKSALQKRGEDNLALALQNYEALQAKRQEIGNVLNKREYEIVTEVLSALNDSGKAPKIIHYLATNPTFEPITISTLVTVIKLGSMNLTALFKALDQSNLVGIVLQDLISDCSFYVDIFDIAKTIITDLAQKVETILKNGINSLVTREYQNMPPIDSVGELNPRDLDDVTVNLLQSLGNSGLASSVVKAIITDPSYIPFAVQLVKEVIASNAISLPELVAALKDSNLLSNLVKEFLNLSTVQTIATNAFAAFSGQCPTSASSVIDSSYIHKTSTQGSTQNYNPCKRKRENKSNKYY